MNGNGDRNQKVSHEVWKDAEPVTIATVMLLSDSAQKMVAMVTLMLRRLFGPTGPTAAPVHAKSDLFTVLTR